ncbi:hypothetical protein Cabther_A2213 [Chloracidobacterium thermophilum B]|uniref:Uncharacterized protein n=1 Tax=Chloracidobacterium thermophilum (strain B) TaxID=981222 RepID=G2LDU2_CHLTF|nr:hypothetical protein Cabther_A2213 [Chloracidobacterium thermophilum B]
MEQANAADGQSDTKAVQQHIGKASAAFRRERLPPFVQRGIGDGNHRCAQSGLPRLPPVGPAQGHVPEHGQQRILGDVPQLAQEEVQAFKLLLIQVGPPPPQPAVGHRRGVAPGKPVA